MLAWFNISHRKKQSLWVKFTKAIHIFVIMMFLLRKLRHVLRMGRVALHVI